MKSITIKDIHLHPIAMPYVEPLRTSFGQEPFKAGVLVELITDNGIVGWGESSVEINPGYGSETVGTGYHILKEFLVPKLAGKTIASPTEVPGHLKSVRGNKHVKHGIEGAVWDAFAKANDLRLADLMASYLPDGHASKNYAWVGVSIGIQPSVEATLAIINKRVAQGYGRIKLKIQPGWDIELARGVRAALPDILLMLDANSAYTLEDAAHLALLDDLDLLMIEQPLGDEDIYEHSKLQPQIETRICLDESIKSVNDLRLAIELGAIRILNLKPARVGGFTECLDIYRVCVEHDLPLWIGGMLETGIGRAANVALASLPGVTLPCDISATDRYFNPFYAAPPPILENADLFKSEITHHYLAVVSTLWMLNAHRFMMALANQFVWLSPDDNAVPRYHGYYEIDSGCYLHIVPFEQAGFPAEPVLFMLEQWAASIEGKPEKEPVVEVRLDINGAVGCVVLFDSADQHGIRRVEHVLHSVGDIPCVLVDVRSPAADTQEDLSALNRHIVKIYDTYHRIIVNQVMRELCTLLAPEVSARLLPAFSP